MVVTQKIKGFIREWTKALTSGEYAQTADNLNNRNGYCCLGVACKVFIPKEKLVLIDDYIDGGLPSEQENAPDWLIEIDDDFAKRTGKTLSYLNDNGVSFHDIAQKLKETYLGKRVKPLKEQE